MQQFLQLVLALTLLIGGGGWLYAQMFILDDMLPLPLAAAATATVGGAAWLYGDFIFPLIGGGAGMPAKPDARKRQGATQ